ncbi:glycosyltransferase family 87 protein [Acidocella sp.]|uniref:glycosyltransferase family 87 protein n=2 Tax=Acidocella sp. TaxID=50710 RepID=UPI002617A4AB|nr:glycosyltransferase family 87 protein [Acidocella sp.]
MRKLFPTLTVMALASLCAVILDMQIMDRRLLQTHTLVPGDLTQFRTIAAFAVHAHNGLAIAAKNLLYPPPFLILALPLSWLSPTDAYLAWMLVGSATLAIATLFLSDSRAVLVLTLVSSATLYCLAMGQTGEFVSGLLLIALSQADRRPTLAGIASGFLIIKPQFGLLLPICFLASRNWRSLISASVTAVLLIALPCLIFTPDIWRAYLDHNTIVARHFIDQSWPQFYQYPAVTVFLTLRSLGVDLYTTYICQGVASVAAALFCWLVWRPSASVAPLNRLALTLCLVFLATPYAYVYDLPALGAALAAQAAGENWRRLAPLALFWIFTSLFIFFAIKLFLVGAPVIAAIAMLIWRSHAVPVRAAHI